MLEHFVFLHHNFLCVFFLMTQIMNNVLVAVIYTHRISFLCTKHMGYFCFQYYWIIWSYIHSIYKCVRWGTWFKMTVFPIFTLWLIIALNPVKHKLKVIAEIPNEIDALPQNQVHIFFISWYKVQWDGKWPLPSLVMHFPSKFLPLKLLTALLWHQSALFP